MDNQARRKCVARRSLLTGDPKQLDSVSGAGGMLAATRTGMTSARDCQAYGVSPPKRRNGPTIRKEPRPAAGGKVNRKRPLRLRDGGDRLDEASVNQCRQLVDEYLAHDRIHWGEDADVEEDAYQMCIKWQSNGQVDIADRRNERAGTRHQQNGSSSNGARKAKSESDPDKLFQLRDGLDVGSGDQIVCRDNMKDIHGQNGRSLENGMTFRGHLHRQVRRTMREPLR